MFWIDLLFVVFFALLLSSIMSWGFRWRHPARRDTVGASFVFLFFILLVVMWASVAWMVPWGPVIYGTHWLGLLLTGVFVSLLILAVAAPVRPIKTRTPAEAEQVRKEVETATAFGVFF
ncbi:MAG: hypothetical protein P8Y00_03160, partial [Deltaproteobacteria bacterium]